MTKIKEEYQLFNPKNIERCRVDERFFNDMISSDEAKKFYKYVLRKFVKSPNALLKTQNIDKLDLEQICITGIVKAILTADTSKTQEEITTFATYKIKGEIKRFIRSNSPNTIKLTESVRSNEHKYHNLRSDFLSAYNREPELMEIVNHLDVSERIASELIYGTKPTTGDRKDDDLREDEVYDRINTLPDQVDIQEEVERKMYIEHVMDQLRPEDKIVLELKFFQGKTTKEITSMLNISREIQNRRLKRAFQDLGIDKINLR